MCMLSFYVEGAMPIREHLENGADSNRDGSGYAILARGELLVGKSMDQADMIDEFMAMRALYPDGPALFHSRIGTGGEFTADNCHPYYAGADTQTVIAHNGIMFSVPKGDKRSDTRIFAEDIFPKFYRRLNRPTVVRALDDYVAKGYNKVAIITANPRYLKPWHLFGEAKGYWVDGDGKTVPSMIDGETAWHSNTDFRGWKSYTGWGYGSTTWGKSSGGWKSSIGKPIQWAKTGESTWKAVYPGDADYIDYDVRAEREDWYHCDWCQCEFCVDPLTSVCSNCRGCAYCGNHIRDCDCEPADLGITAMGPADDKPEAGVTGRPLALESAEAANKRKAEEAVRTILDEYQDA